jgi:hypothetical protein
MEQATDQGYNGSHVDGSRLRDIFSITDLSSISWMTIVELTGTLIDLVTFSLIRVQLAPNEVCDICQLVTNMLKVDDVTVFQLDQTRMLIRRRRESVVIGY